MVVVHLLFVMFTTDIDREHISHSYFWLTFFKKKCLFIALNSGFVLNNRCFYESFPYFRFTTNIKYNLGDSGLHV